jgi:hypothetical protein
MKAVLFFALVACIAFLASAKIDKIASANLNKSPDLPPVVIPEQIRTPFSDKDVAEFKAFRNNQDKYCAACQAIVEDIWSGRSKYSASKKALQPSTCDKNKSTECTEIEDMVNELFQDNSKDNAFTFMAGQSCLKGVPSKSRVVCGHMFVKSTNPKFKDSTLCEQPESVYCDKGVDFREDQLPLPPVAKYYLSALTLKRDMKQQKNVYKATMTNLKTMEKNLKAYQKK